MSDFWFGVRGAFVLVPAGCAIYFRWAGSRVDDATSTRVEYGGARVDFHLALRSLFTNPPLLALCTAFFLPVFLSFDTFGLLILIPPFTLHAQFVFMLPLTRANSSLLSFPPLTVLLPQTPKRVA